MKYEGGGLGDLTRPVQDAHDICLLARNVEGIGNTRESSAKVQRNYEAVISKVSDGGRHSELDLANLNFGSEEYAMD